MHSCSPPQAESIRLQNCSTDLRSLNEPWMVAALAQLHLDIEKLRKKDKTHMEKISEQL